MRRPSSRSSPIRPSPGGGATFDEERVEKELIVGEPDLRVYAIEVDGHIVGAIQSFEEPEPEFRTRASTSSSPTRYRAMAWGRPPSGSSPVA
jgi:hypothetical protein